MLSTRWSRILSAARPTIDGFPDFQIPDLQVAIADYLRAGRLTNAAVCCVGLSINFSSLGNVDYRGYVARTRERHGLPVCDPMRGGVAELASALLKL